MSELRREPITRRWVLITPEPLKISSPPYSSFNFPQTEANLCPFCPGKEDQTPLEIYAIRREGMEQNPKEWLVRVVPNKFPFFRIEGDLNRRPEGMYDVMNGIGAHEIVIESPTHDENWSTMEESQLERVLKVYEERYIDLKKDKRFKHIIIVKSQFGQTVFHPHSHIVAMPFVPRRIDEETGGAIDYYRRKDRCIYCDIINEEIACKKRVITENGSFLSFAPFASRYPFETWIIPKDHIPNFAEDLKKASLAKILKEVFTQINSLLSHPPSSVVFHTSPLEYSYSAEYHWHIEIRPRVKEGMGFEWGTGFFVNSVTPEEATNLLRGESG